MVIEAIFSGAASIIIRVARRAGLAGIRVMGECTALADKGSRRRQRVDNDITAFGKLPVVNMFFGHFLLSIRSSCALSRRL